MERNDAMSAEYETVKSSDYERKVFKADSEKKKHPALAVLFLLLTLIFVTLAFLIPPAFVVIIGYAISLLSVLLFVAAGVCLSISVAMFVGVQTVVCPYCGAEYYISPKQKKLRCRKCKKHSSRR